MTDLADRLAGQAAAAGLPVARVARQHLLHGLLRRWSLSSHAGAFLLRGALMTQLWVGSHRRTTRDVDFVGLYPIDQDATTARLLEVLTTPTEPDGVRLDIDTLRGEVIWQETDFPGLRYFVQAELLGEGRELQIDVGFGDPVVPPAWWIDYPAVIGPPARVHAVRPELLVAWKLDGLFDHGARRWQAKDLFDLYLLTGHCPLDLPTLVEAIRVAFEAHADPLPEVLDVVYSRAWWEKETSQNRWAKFRAASEVPVPEDLVEVAATVAQALRPALSHLVTFPPDKKEI